MEVAGARFSLSRDGATALLEPPDNQQYIPSGGRRYTALKKSVFPPEDSLNAPRTSVPLNEGTKYSYVYMCEAC